MELPPTPPPLRRICRRRLRVSVPRPDGQVAATVPPIRKSSTSKCRSASRTAQSFSCPSTSTSAQCAAYQRRASTSWAQRHTSRCPAGRESCAELSRCPAWEDSASPEELCAPRVTRGPPPRARAFRRNLFHFKFEFEVQFQTDIARAREVTKGATRTAPCAPAARRAWSTRSSRASRSAASTAAALARRQQHESEAVASSASAKSASTVEDGNQDAASTASIGGARHSNGVHREHQRVLAQFAQRRSALLVAAGRAARDADTRSNIGAKCVTMRRSFGAAVHAPRVRGRGRVYRRRRPR